MYTCPQIYPGQRRRECLKTSHGGGVRGGVQEGWELFGSHRRAVLLEALVCTGKTLTPTSQLFNINSLLDWNGLIVQPPLCNAVGCKLDLFCCYQDLQEGGGGLSVSLHEDRNWQWSITPKKSDMREECQFVCKSSHDICMVDDNALSLLCFSKVERLTKYPKNHTLI